MSPLAGIRRQSAHLILRASNSFPSTINGTRTYSDYPAEPIPNRPLRGRQSKFSNSNHSSNSSKPERPHRKFPNSDENRNSFKPETDVSFLERFKLDFENKVQNPNPELAKSEEVEKSEEKVVAAPEEADVIFKKMKETGLIPNAVAMLDGLCKDGLVQDAMKLFTLMREKGAIPEVVIYTAVVEGFCQAQKFDDAKRIFRKMQSNGIVPNAYSYGVFVRGLCNGMMVDDAALFSMEMLEAGYSPNLQTFVGLVGVYCKERGLEEAQKVIGDMKHKGFFVEEKAVREYLDKKGPFMPLVWEAILGKNASKRSLF